jgi:hypothetical protein
MFRTLNLGSSSGTHYLKSHTIYTNWYNCLPIPVAVWSKASVCGRSLTRIVGSNPTIPNCECCVLSGRGLCDELIPRPEESYWVWCVYCVWSWSLEMRRPRHPKRGCRARGRGGYNCLQEFFTIVYIHCLKQIKVEDCGCWLFQSYVG